MSLTQFWIRCRYVARLVYILSPMLLIFISLLFLFLLSLIVVIPIEIALTFIPPPLLTLAKKLVPKEFIPLQAGISSTLFTDMNAATDMPSPFSQIHWLQDIVSLQALAVRQQIGLEIWQRMIEDNSGNAEPWRQQHEELDNAMHELDMMQPLVKFLDYSNPGLRDRTMVSKFPTRLWQTVDPWILRRRMPMPSLEDFRQYRLARDKEELRTDVGHQVWLSKAAGPEYASHWLLIIDGKKYELRRTSKKDRRRIPTRKNQKYTFLTDDAGEIDVEQRKVYLERPPRVSTSHGNFSLYLVGWTVFDNQQIIDTCEEVIKDWRYHILWPEMRKGRRGNCQDFLRRVAERIIPEENRALDWALFYRGDLGLWEKAELEEVLNTTGDGPWWERDSIPKSLLGAYIWRGAFSHLGGYD